MTLRLALPAISALIMVAMLAGDVLAQATTYTVNSIDDVADGICNATHCSLREAIDAANTNAGTDTIAFGIAGSGPHTIEPTSVLPTITDPVIIDGYSQAGTSANTDPNGFNGTLMIELAGTNLSGGDKFGLRITSGGSTIRGLVINRFTERGGGIGYGLFLEQGGGNTIQGNFIGIDVSGASSPTVVGSRQGYGMMLEGSSDNLIGGPMPADRNVISGFLRRGTEFRVLQRLPFSSSANNRIQGNFVGTDRTGTSAVWPFGSDGISPGGGSNTSNLVGGPGPGEGNLISGTGGAGILLNPNPPKEGVGLAS